MKRGAFALGRVLVLLMSFCALASGAAEAHRLALVIGNGAYAHAPPLPNPPRDARAVAAAFRRLGFDVVEGIDLGRAELVRALRDFGRRSDSAELAVVYFAGHGIQVKGQNYILPIDAQLEREQDLGYEAISVQAVLDEAVGARRLRLVILDACRDNPFVARLQRDMGAARSMSVGRGLKIIETIAPDTLIAYATTADAIAEDGSGEHSPYTAALLEHLETPGLELNLLFGRVRDAVMRRTNNRQQPFTYGSLGGDAIVLKPAAAARTEPPPASPPSADAFELAFWDSIRQSESVADYRAYLEAYPNGRFAPLARARIAALEPPTTSAAPGRAAAPSSSVVDQPPAAPPATATPPVETRRPNASPPAVARTPDVPPPLPARKPVPPEPLRTASRQEAPAPAQEARVPPASRAAELRDCPAPGTRIVLSSGDVLSFGSGANFVCELGHGIPGKSVLAFAAGPDPRHVQWQGLPPRPPLAPGARFAFISEGMGDFGPSAWYHEFRVKGPTQVSTKAGRFDVVVLEESRTGWNNNEYEARLRHYWSPELGFVVKQEVLSEFTNRGNTGNRYNRGGPSFGAWGRESWESVSVTRP
ncbi:MAG: caspase family protein [Rhodospirillales bacterium]|nr:caspase family protein [Rhodospirillales bacterium]